jgi:multidrug efflux pump subunit AcrA (membrane-fusion protein)
VQSLGKSYLLSAQLNKDTELQPGQMLSAEFQDATRTTTGIKLPRAAVLRWQGQQWAFVEKQAGHYQRVPLTIAQWLDDAVLISAGSEQGIKPGDKIVTTGAGMLLGAELKPADAAKEE